MMLLKYVDLDPTVQYDVTCNQTQVEPGLPDACYAVPQSTITSTVSTTDSTTSTTIGSSSTESSSLPVTPDVVTTPQSITTSTASTTDPTRSTTIGASSTTSNTVTVTSDVTAAVSESSTNEATKDSASDDDEHVHGYVIGRYMYCAFFQSAEPDQRTLLVAIHINWNL